MGPLRISFRVVAFFALTVLVVVVCAGSPAIEKPLPAVINFFYMESCPGCQGFRDAQDIIGRLNALARKNPDMQIRIYNLHETSDAAEIMSRVWKEKRPQDAPFHLPVLLLDGKPIHGYEDIENKVAELKR